MCIEVQISYPRCSHIHHGCELCPGFNANHRYCALSQVQLRREPFCPICSKSAYRAHRRRPTSTLTLQSTLDSTLDSTLEPIRQINCVVDVVDVGLPRMAELCEPLAKDPFEADKQALVNTTGPETGSVLSPVPLGPQLQNPTPRIPPPHPMEPPLNPNDFGPHQYREYLQKEAMVPTLKSWSPSRSTGAQVGWPGEATT